MLLDLCLNDIDFDKVPVTCYSSRGSPFTRWIGVGMPRVPDKVLNCTFYLYESKKAAEQGEAYGGTGFLVTVLSQRFSDIAGSHSVYAVTNRHVAVRGGFSVIRINTYEGVEIFETDPSDWTVHPDGDDIAVFPLLLANPRNKGAVGIAPGAFGTKEQLAELDIGVGDNVFMIGRFVDHDGGPVNRPAARFGNISVMPSPIEDNYGNTVESYCVDMHSRTGYSGSPVFVYRTPFDNLHSMFESGTLQMGSGALILLGIHWGQFPDQLQVIDAEASDPATGVELVLKKYLKGASGMNIVSPAYRILDVINLDVFKKQRAARDELIGGNGMLPIEEAASPTAASTHKEDFNSLLDAAVRGKP